jgi:heptosyltransferase-2
LKSAYPNARITYLVKKQYAELLASSPYIDELITFDKNEGFAGLERIIKSLRNQHFDIFLDIHKNWRSRYLRFRLNAAKTTSYSKHIFKRTLLIWFKINLYKKILPVYERYFDSVKDFGIGYDGQGTDIHLPESASEKVRIMLAEAGFGMNSPLIILCPSATYLNKRWKPSGFIDTAQFLIRERSAFIVILGGREDIPLCQEVAESIGGNVVSMAGLLSLAESCALLRMSNLVIANDSGLLHMAQSQKKPVVALYGPTTRELGYFPIEKDSTVIETTLSCRPCTHNGLNYCPKKHFRCMNDLSSELVIKAALQYLP